MKPVVVPVAFSFALLTACGGSDSHPRAASNPPQVPVQVTTVASQQWPVMYEATGTVRARSAAVISSKVMAYVQQAAFQAGDRVREGQVVVTLDARDLDVNVRRAEAARQEVRSAIPEADHGVAAAMSNLDLARSTFKRMDELLSKKSISNQEFDEVSARLKAAQAACDMARSRRVQLDSKLAQVEEEIRAAAIMRDYARIAAPFAGVVTAKSVEAGSMAVPGAPLLTIEREGGYRLEVSIDEIRLSSVKTNQPVEIALDAVDRRVVGRVSEIAPAVDASSRASTVKIDLPPLPNLRSGMYGRASFPLGTRKVVVVPATALIERGQLQSIFVIEDGKACTRLVTAGSRFRSDIELLSGVSEGERIVMVVSAGLADGSRVEARQ